MARSSSRLGSVITFILLSLLTLAGYILMRDLNGPIVTFSPEFGDRLGPKQEIILMAEDAAGIRKVEINVQRGGKRMTILEQSFDDKPDSIDLAFNLEKADLPEGAFTLEVKVYDASFAGFGSGNSTTYENTINLDNKPPYIEVRTTTPGIKKGGAALVVYEVKEEVQKTGIYVDDIFFAGYEQEENVYVCLFAFPHNVNINDFSPQIYAKDLAGNVTQSSLKVNARNVNFREDDMNVSDKFLNNIKGELIKLSPERETLLEKYIESNTQIRKKDLQIFKIIGEKSMNKPQWEGSFQVLPRSQVMAYYGDKRTYIYKEKVIDNQVHQGIDYASVAKADIPATNNGKVVFAEPLGIHGNVVIIDHGVGLFSLYSHLTDIFVKVGDVVKTGHTVGTTGKTGLAGGDHVHYGILISGIAVNPLEWLDKKWVQYSITDRLKLAN